MDSNYYKKYEPIFNTWHIKGLLGEGSFGKVYKIERQDFGVVYEAALKAITIPQSQSEVKSIMADGMDEASATSYLRQVVEDIVGEFVLMSKLKGNSNIVSYEDHIVEQHTQGIGWDILIRMELLTPLIDHVRTENLTRKDIIKLGIDMCKALELCQKYNIIHRDIKPENIFISANGDYKLGDFGIARTVEKTTSGLSKKGTYVYMAPEIYRGEAYGSSVDIYSLGIVMYRLLNENRTPFLPAYPAPITHNDREAAVMKRISGSAMHTPVNAVGRLAEIVLKACAYLPKDRYSSPMQMREELEAILYNKEEAKIIYPKGDEAPIKSIEYISTGEEITVIDSTNSTDISPNIAPKSKATGVGALAVDRTESVFGDKHKEFTVNKTESDIGSSKIIPVKRKPFKWLIPVAAVVAVLLIAGGAWVLNLPKEVAVTAIAGIDNIIELETGITMQLSPSIEPQNATDKNVTYSSENKLVATVSETGEITALLAGETKITVNVGGLDKVITVSVKEPHRVIEEWRNEGYEDAPPYKEFERLYRDGVATDEIRYTGNQKPQETQTNTGGSTSSTKPLSGNTQKDGNSSNNNSGAQQTPSQPPAQQEQPPVQNDPPPNSDKPPEVYVDFD